MGAAVHESMSPRPPDPPFRPAGADVSEPDTSQGVATVAFLVDAERDPLYGDRVKHVYDSAAHRWNKQCPYGDLCSGCDAAGYCAPEETRLGRLSRWQEQR